MTEAHTLKKQLAVVISCWICLMVAPVHAQQVDVAVAGGSLASSGNSISTGSFLPTEGGGTYIGFNADVLIKHHLGVEGEVNWRASQGLYAGQFPYRPVFWDFNAIYARRFSKLVGAEVLAGVGGETVRLYEGALNCDIYGNCTSYVSSNHFMGDVGGGIRFYVFHNFFVRPEGRLYLIHNNQEFSSSHPVRFGASIGYTFGGSK
jgi:hypothetical protein